MYIPETSGMGINSILIDNLENSDFIDMQGLHIKDPKTSGIYLQNKKKAFVKKLFQDDFELNSFKQNVLINNYESNFLDLLRRHLRVGYLCALFQH